MTNPIIGIMGAMPEEIDGVISLMDNPQCTIIGMRTYTSGTINGTCAVVVFSRWGKVAASATAATLIHAFKITELIFTGVAGAIDPTLKVGDVVAAKRLIQHDLDARPLMQRFEIPLLGMTYLEIPEKRMDEIKEAIAPLFINRTLQENIGKSILSEFGITAPNLHIGDIASGDRFFASELQKQQLNEALPTVLCVEMEGAAVAQVCYEHNLPFTVIRTISDTADENSHIDFPRFIENVSSRYSVAIIQALLKD
ncbi:5'-methylthioadenosine/adenosylhomocysteine nucleosidase [Flavobacterium sp. MFBS3-15]|uniref:5'-methylthioadenosine/adenosylhomocysteine nucleosidase n=1 Tax=Flavobacterium sp. MFBS3-15 TaxID=2989816 RepID=UPI002235935A|nr:5'-methylthioadenosine/adenosylhomocysteine nucleosidase [Flavobacterium sp. MFBS3-15]MCW4470120.1 5'-methylthioadenosine/adenosylhomocysteine nucleosidase [Flavobacterium sp. MFBS3-15]